MPEDQKYTFEEWKAISDKLNRQLGPEYLSQRPGPSGRPLTYIEGKTAINIANDIFGFNGWSTHIKDVTVDFLDVDNDGRVSIGVAVTVRITLKDGSYHEDQGYGSDINARNKAVAFEKARKQGVTDATKRTLRAFGNVLGNCLYDSPYLGGIGKMAKPTIKFQPKNLYRHEQFETPKVEVAPTAIETKQPPQQQRQEPLSIQSKPVQQQPQPQRSNNNANKNTVNQNSNSNDKNKSLQTPQPQQQAESSTSVDRHSLMEPVIPEDSFSYEGDDEFLVQMLAADEIDFHVDDEIDNEMLAGIITPPPISAPSTQIKREAPLSDLDDDHSNNKKQKSTQ